MRCLCCLMMSRLTYTTAPSSAFPLPSDCSACVSPCRTMPRSLLLHCHGCIPSIGIYYKKHPLNWRWKVVFHEFVDSNIDRELHQVSANFSQLLNAQSIWSSTFHKGITDSSTHSTTINHHISAHSLDRRRILWMNQILQRPFTDLSPLAYVKELLFDNIRRPKTSQDSTNNKFLTCPTNAKTNKLVEYETETYWHQFQQYHQFWLLFNTITLDIEGLRGPLLLSLLTMSLIGKKPSSQWGQWTKGQRREERNWTGRDEKLAGNISRPKCCDSLKASRWSKRQQSVITWSHGHSNEWWLWNPSTSMPHTTWNSYEFLRRIFTSSLIEISYELLRY